MAAGRPQITDFGRIFGSSQGDTYPRNTHAPNATRSVSLRDHGTGKRDHGTERGVELSRITVPRGTGIGREHVG